MAASVGNGARTRSISMLPIVTGTTWEDRRHFREIHTWLLPARSARCTNEDLGASSATSSTVSSIVLQRTQHSGDHCGAVDTLADTDSPDACDAVNEFAAGGGAGDGVTAGGDGALAVLGPSYFQAANDTAGDAIEAVTGENASINSGFTSVLNSLFTTACDCDNKPGNKRSSGCVTVSAVIGATGGGGGTAGIIAALEAAGAGSEVEAGACLKWSMKRLATSLFTAACVEEGGAGASDAGLGSESSAAGGDAASKRAFKAAP